MNRVKIIEHDDSENGSPDTRGVWVITDHSVRSDILYGCIRCKRTEELRLVRVTEFGVDDTIDGGQNTTPSAIGDNKT